MTPQEILDLIVLARNVKHRYALDDYEIQALKPLLKAVSQAQREILQRIEQRAASLPEWSEERALALLDELSDLTLGIQTRINGDISGMASHAGAESYLLHNDVVSFGGKVLDFNNVALSAGQIAQLIEKTPVGGKLLNEWIRSSFDWRLQEEIQQEITAGLLQGEGYPGLVRRLGQGFDLTKQDAISVARTYVQSVNCNAQMDVYRANKQVVKGWRWTAVMEPGYGKTGRGTCIICQSLDGREYAVDDPGAPPLPNHLRCRCMAIPTLISWRELGLDMDEMKDVFRPYTIRPDKNIDAGGKREILEVGFHQGDYASWFATRDRAFQLNAVGPGRLELLESGKVKFEDLVDRSGRLRLLDRVDGKVVGLKGFAAGGEGGGGLGGLGGIKEPPSWQPTMTRTQAEEWIKDSKLTGDMYHVTKPENIALIEKEGFETGRVGLGKVWGDGVYVAPDIESVNFYKNMIGENAEYLTLKIKIENPFILSGDILESSLSSNPQIWNKVMAEEKRLTAFNNKIEILADKKFPFDPTSLFSSNIDEKEIWMQSQGFIKGNLNPQAVANIMKKEGYDSILIQELGARVTEPRQIVIFDPKKVVVVK